MKRVRDEHYNRDEREPGGCPWWQLRHHSAHAYFSHASGVGMGPRISGARTNGEAVIRISLRDAVMDTCLDQSSLNSAILVSKVSFESSGLFHTSLGSVVK